MEETNKEIILHLKDILDECKGRRETRTKRNSCFN